MIEYFKKNYKKRYLVFLGPVFFVVGAWIAKTEILFIIFVHNIYFITSLVRTIFLSLVASDGLNFYKTLFSLFNYMCIVDTSSNGNEEIQLIFIFTLL